MVSAGGLGAGSGPPNTSARAKSYSRRGTLTRAPQRPSSAPQKNRRCIMVSFLHSSFRHFQLQKPEAQRQFLSQIPNLCSSFKKIVVQRHPSEAAFIHRSIGAANLARAERHFSPGSSDRPSS